MALQVTSDEKRDSDGNLIDGYSAALDWLSTEAGVAARLSGEPMDEYLSVYIKSDPFNGGSPRTHTRFGTVDNDAVLEVGDTGDEGGFEIRALMGGANNQAEFAALNSVNNKALRLCYDEDLNVSQLKDRLSGSSLLYYYHDPEEIFWGGDPMTGLREIKNPTAGDFASQERAWDAANSRWLFKDSDGTAHYFTPDGTL